MNTDDSRSTTFANWLCAVFYTFCQLLALALGAVSVAWILLGWWATKKLWGTPGGGSALALWIAGLIVLVWLIIGEQVSAKLDHLDAKIEQKARAWKEG